MNVIIHSLVFSIGVTDELRISGFYVTSDRYRYDRIWFVEIQNFIQTMREVGKDYPSSKCSVWNDAKNDWDTWQGHGQPPEDFMRRAGATTMSNPLKDGESC